MFAIIKKVKRMFSTALHPSSPWRLSAAYSPHSWDVWFSKNTVLENDTTRYWRWTFGWSLRLGRTIEYPVVKLKLNAKLYLKSVVEPRPHDNSRRTKRSLKNWYEQYLELDGIFFTTKRRARQQAKNWRSTFSRSKMATHDEESGRPTVEGRVGCM